MEGLTPEMVANRSYVPWELRGFFRLRGKRDAYVLILQQMIRTSVETAASDIPWGAAR